MPEVQICWNFREISFRYNDIDIFRFFVFLTVRLYFAIESFEIYSVESLHHGESRTVKIFAVALTVYEI